MIIGPASKLQVTARLSDGPMCQKEVRETLAGRNKCVVAELLEGLRMKCSTGSVNTNR